VKDKLWEAHFSTGEDGTEEILFYTGGQAIREMVSLVSGFPKTTESHWKASQKGLNPTRFGKLRVQTALRVTGRRGGDNGADMIDSDKLAGGEEIMERIW
jgi:hypothetical protein